jgi:A/G-specific adenine glycosylase
LVASLTGRRRSSRDRSHIVRISAQRRLAFGRQLRRWFRANGRDLPWRRTRDPYHILVSELMLQQTQVARVVDYYARFLERFPTLADVGRAHPSHVLEAWSGLGYYNRARNLHRLASTLTDHGRSRDSSLPDDPRELIRLPGIGPYTAGAIASFAYTRRAALVDTNVARVLRRVFAPRLNVATSGGQKAIWQIARALLPRAGAHGWTHNQALMELGAVVCTARVARCEACPVSSVCRSAFRAVELRSRTSKDRHGKSTVV